MSATPSAPSPADSGGANTLDALRRHGVQVWAVIGWVVLGLLLLMNITLHASLAVPLLLIGVATNAGPTAMALAGRYDAEARTLVGSLAAILPATMVFVLRGHPWQMDAHMYFFVAMAGLVVLADWRPLVLATAITAGHHMMFQWLAPQWVFTGTGNSGRVLFHAVAVVLQCVVLIILGTRLERLVNAQDAAVAGARASAETAELERGRALAAMEQARTAEAHAARERREREFATANALAARREELLTLADRFERSVTSVVNAIGDATERLAASALHLDETVVGADHAAGDVSAGASFASAELAEVAASIHDLSRSVLTVAATAGRQTALTGQASDEAERSVRTVAMLEEQTMLIEGLVGDISRIARRTNLLALNATIEAARAGEAGRGFSVVASEVKSLAANSKRTSDQISQLLTGIRDGVSDTGRKLRSVYGAIGEVAAAANNIASAVEQQQTTARSVGAGTDRAVATSTTIERRIAQVADATATVTSLSTAVKRSASELAGSARELRTSTDLFVSFLQRRDPLAA